MGSDLEVLALGLLDKAVEGCCKDDPWRMRLCQYHQGYEDGMLDLIDAMSAPLPPQEQTP